MEHTPDSAARVEDATTALEKLIDQHGLGNVLECVALVCEEKADHIRLNWQDKQTANAWAVASRAIDSVALRIRKLKL